MGKTKTDSVEFTTKRSLQALSNDLRGAANATKAEVQKLQQDALSVDEIQPQIAVLLSGSNFMGGTRMWGVQVALYDLGDRRVAELIALGDSLMDGIMSYYTGGYFQLSDSKRRRDKILAILTKDDTTVRLGVHPDGEDDPAGSGAAPAAAASSGGTSASADNSKVPAVSPDGVDPLSSSLYPRMKMLDFNRPQEDYGHVANTMFGVVGKNFADAHPDFPAGSELKMLYAVGTEEGSQERYIYQPYIDLFPDPSDAIETLSRELFAWVDKHPDDAVACCLLANDASNTHDFDTLNESLYKALVAESHGAKVDDVLSYWGLLALAGGFEEWYIGRFGMREAAAPTRSVEPAPQPRVQAPEKAGGTKHPEAFGPAGGSGAGDDKFMPLTANPQGRKIVVVSLGIALAMIVLLLLMGKTSIFSLIAPAILFILLLMNVDVDSAPMAIPATILAVLAFLNLVRFGAQGMLLFSFLVNAGVAVVYWLLALKKKIAPKMAAGLLLLLFGIRILMGVFSLFSAFRYSIFSVMSSLSVCIMYMSYFAAVLFACKHMVGKGLPEK